MNEKKSFIIEDLDSHHLVIKADEEYRVREELNQEVTSQPLSLPLSILANLDSSWRKTHTVWNHDISPTFIVCLFKCNSGSYALKF